LWFIRQLLGKSSEYHMPMAVRLRGGLDQQALVRAVNTIVERHESLRTHFDMVAGQPVQVIVPVLRIEVPVEDVSGLDEASRQGAVAVALRREGEAPLYLARGAGVRLRLLRLGGPDPAVLGAVPPIPSDGLAAGGFPPR